MNEMNKVRVQVEFSGISRVLTGKTESTLEIEPGSDIEEVIRNLAKSYPQLVGEIIDKNENRLIPSNLFSINGEKILHEMDIEYQPKNGDRLILLSLLSGG